MHATTEIAAGRLAGRPWSLELLTPKPFTDWPEAARDRFDEQRRGREIVDARHQPARRVATVRLRDRGEDHPFSAHLHNLRDVLSAGAWVPDLDEERPESPALLFGACAPEVARIEWATDDRRYTATPSSDPHPDAGGWYTIALSARDLAHGTVIGRDARGEELSGWGASRLLLEGTGYLIRRLGSIAPIGRGELPGGGRWELFARADTHAIVCAVTLDGRARLIAQAPLPAREGVAVLPRLSPPDGLELVLGTIGGDVHQVRAETAEGRPGELVRIAAPDLPVELFLAWSSHAPLERFTALDDHGEVIGESSSGRAAIVRPA